MGQFRSARKCESESGGASECSHRWKSARIHQCQNTKNCISQIEKTTYKKTTCHSLSGPKRQVTARSACCIAGSARPLHYRLFLGLPEIQPGSLRDPPNRVRVIEGDPTMHGVIRA